MKGVAQFMKDSVCFKSDQGIECILAGNVKSVFIEPNKGVHVTYTPTCGGPIGVEYDRLSREAFHSPVLLDKNYKKFDDFVAIHGCGKAQHTRFMKIEDLKDYK